MSLKRIDPSGPKQTPLSVILDRLANRLTKIAAELRKLAKRQVPAEIGRINAPSLDGRISLPAPAAGITIEAVGGAVLSGAAMKSLSCAPSSEKHVCIVYGLNKNAIPDG